MNRSRTKLASTRTGALLLFMFCTSCGGNVKRQHPGLQQPSTPQQNPKKQSPPAGEQQPLSEPQAALVDPTKVAAVFDAWKSQLTVMTAPGTQLRIYRFKPDYSRSEAAYLTILPVGAP